MTKTKFLVPLSIVILSIIFLCIVACSNSQSTDDGHMLWFKTSGTKVVKDVDKNNSDTATIDIAKAELSQYGKNEDEVELEILNPKNQELGDQGYKIDASNSDKIKISANTQIGLLYATYAYMREDKTGQLAKIVQTETPSYNDRILDHWDNPNGTIERGYAGSSLWKWEELPNKIRPEYEEYARANAAIGINGSVLNNVNADVCMLTQEYLEKVKVLADIFRPYGIKVYLSLNFAAPKHLANLNTSDPLDPQVIKFWKDKVAEIYNYVPDFGGFLVKANSEGQSGPQDYGRCHADGANMLADALKPYGGIVMWRAFVYSPQSEDRAMQAVEEFKPLDGQFRDNVSIQIKNGPVDFQPREPFSPLFGCMTNTNIMPEVQITQEYLGHSIYMAYLHPMWKECLDSDTYQYGQGSTVSAITQGKLRQSSISAIAGVSNIGDDANWCGHDLAQANWYAYGRMAWNTNTSSKQIVEEFLKLAFSNDSEFVSKVSQMMLDSRETIVNYQEPLGLHHIFEMNHHYGPGPWDVLSRPDWCPSYYHKAATDGIGFNRTQTGSNAVSQYNEPLKTLYSNPETCPDELLLWFHHLPWDYKMKNGETLWNALHQKYQEGINSAQSYIDTWDSIKQYIDNKRFSRVRDKLVRQAKDAIWWRDAQMLYFQTFSNLPFPNDVTPSQKKLEWLKNFKLDITNYEAPKMDDLPDYKLE